VRQRAHDLPILRGRHRPVTAQGFELLWRPIGHSRDYRDGKMQIGYGLCAGLTDARWRRSFGANTGDPTIRGDQIGKPQQRLVSAAW
jgi:hypothetical protein